MFMTIDEIHKNFDGQWIYAIDCKENDVGKILGGKVVFHSSNRNDVISAMKDYDKDADTLTYFRYAGKVPDEVIYLL